MIKTHRFLALVSALVLLLAAAAPQRVNAQRSAQAKVYAGNGSPEGVVLGDPGDIFLSFNGTNYFKNAGNGNTGWTPFPLVGGGLSFATSLPGTCTPGVTAAIELSVGPNYYGYYCSATNVWSAFGQFAPSYNAGGGCSGAGTGTGGICFVNAPSTGFVPTVGQSIIRGDLTQNILFQSLNGGPWTPLGPDFSGLTTNYFSIASGVQNAPLSNSPVDYGQTTASTMTDAASGGFATPNGPQTSGSTPCALTVNGAGGKCMHQGSLPTNLPAGSSTISADPTQLALTENTVVNGTQTGWTPLSRVYCVNVTPVTTSGGAVTTPQNMMACPLNANLLNVAGRTLKIHAAGTYTTVASSTAAMTLKATLCTVSGCGSGTVVAVCNIATPALGSVTITADTWELECAPTTQTAGASSVYEHSGKLTIDLAASTTAADSDFLDPTATAVTSAIDSTAALFLQISGAFSVANASNTMTERQLLVEVLD